MRVNRAPAYIGQPLPAATAAPPVPASALLPPPHTALPAACAAAAASATAAAQSTAPAASARAAAATTANAAGGPAAAPLAAAATAMAAGMAPPTQQQLWHAQPSHQPQLPPKPMSDIWQQPHPPSVPTSRPAQVSAQPALQLSGQSTWAAAVAAASLSQYGAAPPSVQAPLMIPVHSLPHLSTSLHPSTKPAAPAPATAAVAPTAGPLPASAAVAPAAGAGQPALLGSLLQAQHLAQLVPRALLQPPPPGRLAAAAMRPCSAGSWRTSPALHMSSPTIPAL